MVVRTKSIGVRLKSSLVDRIESYMVEHDLILTEALTAILELGFGEIESCNSQSSDYQLQLDKLTCEVAELRRMVKNLVDRSNRPVTKSKKVMAQSDRNDDEYQQHGAVVVAKSKKISPHIDLVDRAGDDYEVPDEPEKGLTDEQLSKATGFSLKVIQYDRGLNFSSDERPEYGGYYLNRATDLWESS